MRIGFLRSTDGSGGELPPRCQLEGVDTDVLGEPAQMVCNASQRIEGGELSSERIHRIRYFRAREDQAYPVGAHHGTVRAEIAGTECTETGDRTAAHLR